MYVCLSACLFYILSFTLDFILIQYVAVIFWYFIQETHPEAAYMLHVCIAILLCLYFIQKQYQISHSISLARRPWFHQPGDTGRKGEVIQALLVNIGRIPIRIPKAIFIVKDWETCESVLCHILIDLILSWSSFSDFVANIE